MLRNCFPFTPIIMKLHTNTPHELRMCTLDFGVKRSRVKVTMHWFLKMCFGHICFPFTLHKKSLPLSCRCALLILGSKGQGHNALIPENGLLHNCFPFTPKHHKTSYKDARWVEDVSYWFWSQKVKSQGHNALITENSFRRITAIIKLHSPIPSESRICPNDTGVKNLKGLYWLLREICVPLGQPHSSYNCVGTCSNLGPGEWCFCGDM